MNSACDNEERTDHDHEGHVVHSRVQDARCLLQNKEVIKANYAGQDQAKDMVIAVPIMLRDQGADRDGEQQDSERQHDRPVRLRGDNTQVRHHF